MNLVTPFTNKPYAIPLWIENFKNLKMPRHSIDLLWLDLSESEEISNLLKKTLVEEGPKFRSCRYVNKIDKKYPNLIDMPRLDSKDFLTKRKSVSETMRILFGMIDGDALLWEDDILVPNDAYYKLIKTFNWSSDIYSATVTQYSRNPDWANELLIWHWPKEQLLPNYKGLLESTQVQKEEEKDYGVESIGSAATGFTFYSKDFLRVHYFESSEERGQDVMAGYNINRMGKFLMLDWSIKAIHIGFEEGAVRLYRSKKCKTQFSIPKNYSKKLSDKKGLIIYLPLSLILFNIEKTQEVEQFRFFCDKYNLEFTQTILIPKNEAAYELIANSKQLKNTILKPVDELSNNLNSSFRSLSSNAFIFNAKNKLDSYIATAIAEFYGGHLKILSATSGSYNHDASYWNLDNTSKTNKQYDPHASSIINLSATIIRRDLVDYLVFAPALGNNPAILGFNTSTQLWAKNINIVISSHLTKLADQNIDEDFKYHLGVLFGRSVPIKQLPTFYANTIKRQTDNFGLSSKLFFLGLARDVLHKIIGRRRK